MSLNPKKFRQYVLQILYARHLNPQSTDLKSVMYMLKVSKKMADALNTFVDDILASSVKLDKIITELSKEWSLDRISVLEKQILRFGLYELEKKEHENAVVISEMIRLCKKFSTEASSEYIHAILDAYVKMMDLDSVEN